MYFGSVRFFKHVILSVIALLIIIPTAGCVGFAIQHQQLKTENGLLLARQAQLTALLAAAESVGAASAPAETGGAEPAGAAAGAYPIAYQLEYPQLYVDNSWQYAPDSARTIYLTFDDGPTSLTPDVLDILGRYGIPATFFVVFRDDDFARVQYQRIVNEGHTLAVHSATHDYNIIYRSVEDFLEDFAMLSALLEEVTGVKPEIFRFPGGSVNSYNNAIRTELIAEMLRRGYTYYDWDVSAGSSTNTATRDSIYGSVVNGVSGRDRAIVLLHDAGTRATVEALPGIIEGLLASGYQFGALDKTIRPARFDYLF